MSRTSKSLFTAKNMAYTALMAVLMSVCAWISIPVGDIPITLQTFGVFCSLGLLGGKRGSLAILVYLLLGAVGLPVFSGFSGGLGKLLGPTGGYLIGFLFAAAVYWILTPLIGSSLPRQCLAFCVCCLVYYAFGTIWYVQVYAPGSGAVGFGAALAKCVLPYIIPDAVKLALAIWLTRAVKKYIKL